ncbi:MAG: hypothetical protein ACHQ49_08925 [Elusimicrobiota bacterium]
MKRRHLLAGFCLAATLSAASSAQTSIDCDPAAGCAAVMLGGEFTAATSSPTPSSASNGSGSAASGGGTGSAATAAHPTAPAAPQRNPIPTRAPSGATPPPAAQSKPAPAAPAPSSTAYNPSQVTSDACTQLGLGPMDGNTVTLGWDVSCNPNDVVQTTCSGSWNGSKNGTPCFNGSDSRPPSFYGAFPGNSMGSFACPLGGTMKLLTQRKTSCPETWNQCVGACKVSVNGGYFGSGAKQTQTHPCSADSCGSALWACCIPKSPHMVDCFYGDGTFYEQAPELPASVAANLPGICHPQANAMQKQNGLSSGGYAELIYGDNGQSARSVVDPAACDDATAWACAVYEDQQWGVPIISYGPLGGPDFPWPSSPAAKPAASSVHPRARPLPVTK